MSNNNWNAVLQERLATQEEKYLYRCRQLLSQDKNIISFCSNDYLNLTQHPVVISAFQKAADQYGVGSGASCLIAGYKSPHQAFEEAFADFIGRPRALLFGNGYMANLGVFQALIKSQDSIYQDKLNHASLIDAGLSSQAKLFRYPHKDLNYLQKLLLKNKEFKNKFIISDSVFSMEGDIADIPELVKTAKNNKAVLMVDDAHGIGVLGKTGRGISEYFNLAPEDIDILSSPLGKAFGGYGGVISGSEALIENLIQFSRSYIYTTGLPPAVAAAASASLEIIKTEFWRRERLETLIKYFKKSAQERELNIFNSDTPIQAYKVGGADKTLKISQFLLEKKLFVYAIRPPTVQPNTSRLRIALNCAHQESQIDYLLDSLKAAEKSL